MRVLEFLKSALIGGLVVLLPIVLVSFLVDEAYDFLVAIIDPITEAWPVDDIGGIEVASILAIFLLLGFCVAVGVAVRTTIGSKIMEKVEGKILDRLPTYRLMKTLSRQLTGAAAEGETGFSPAVLSVGKDARQLVYLIEQHDNGFSTIMIPSAPTASVGPIQYVNSERVRPIDAPLGQVMQCIQECGYGGRQYFES